MIMAKFEVGQKVTANDNALTDHYGEVGSVKEILGGYDLPVVVKVEFGDGIIESFMHGELAPADTAAKAALGASNRGGVLDRPEYADYVKRIIELGGEPFSFEQWFGAWLLAHGESPVADAEAAPGGEAGVEDRDAMLRSGLFMRVRKVLEGCNPEIANEFRNYGNLAEKQIQERDIALATLRTERNALAAALKDANLLVLLFGDASVREAIDNRADRDEIWEVFNRWQWTQTYTARPASNTGSTD
jgi:hypothetical protein